jgi:transcriptional regulator with XRE-family HTH domain
MGAKFIAYQTQSVWFWRVQSEKLPTCKTKPKGIERSSYLRRICVAFGLKNSWLHPNYISSVERGERNISIANIENIAFALGVSMGDLVAETKSTEKKKVAHGKASLI